jgi:hypothetical protein
MDDDGDNSYLGANEMPVKQPYGFQCCGSGILPFFDPRIREQEFFFWIPDRIA